MTNDFAKKALINDAISIAVFLFFAIGWVWNIAKITQSGFDVFTGIFIMRVIGVFVPPIGSVLGYF